MVYVNDKNLVILVGIFIQTCWTCVAALSAPRVINIFFFFFNYGGRLYCIVYVGLLNLIIIKFYEKNVLESMRLKFNNIGNPLYKCAKK